MDRGLVTCVSGDGRPYVKAEFGRLEDAQAFHSWLVKDATVIESRLKDAEDAMLAYYSHLESGDFIVKPIAAFLQERGLIDREKSELTEEGKRRLTQAHGESIGE